ncbi:GLPGLI family protein [uncultured Chryseobacterium sp.]|uniref:GLPGLI family protein n=1 Tax=uncultured Chryseobacterium sp. TaxID=259322 RepID=UPI0025CF460C|nr:GLPGLI family protein [uncultured Chryseobacterium sp.]
MKKLLLLVALVLSLFITAQKINFKPTVKVEYNASLKLGEKYRHDQKFFLIGNSEDYYFAADQNYLNDTKQYKAKNGIDLTMLRDYFKERLIEKNGITNVFVNVIDSKIRYQEKVVLKWVLYSDTKMINGVKCQMAATNKYGRRWIAYFSKDYSQPVGPYKFTGLPGLIFELYDTRDDYHFTLAKVEKYTDEFEFNLGQYKNFDKAKYLKAKYNYEFTPAGMPPMEGDMKREYDSALEKLKVMYNNPLELKPFE